ncbi:MAG: hypothetical protein ACRDPC_03130 [Solirubrobacteraceae bacterium]
MARLAVVIVLALALLAPATAAAQQNPFGPLPPPAPTPAPPPPEQDDPFGEDVGRTTLYVIAGALLIAFVAVGVFISRDARRALPRDHRPERGRLREEGAHKRERRAKAKARAKSRQARAARKTTRRKGR